MKEGSARSAKDLAEPIAEFSYLPNLATADVVMYRS